MEQDDHAGAAAGPGAVDFWREARAAGAGDPRGSDLPCRAAIIRVIRSERSPLAMTQQATPSVRTARKTAAASAGTPSGLARLRAVARAVTRAARLTALIAVPCPGTGGTAAPGRSAAPCPRRGVESPASALNGAVLPSAQSATAGLFRAANALA